ncbi:MAG: cytochrome c maturation protein CcmE [bacterium]
MSKKKINVVIAFSIVTGIMIWLFFSGFNENMQYYRTIEEAKTMGKKVYAEGLRVKGNLVAGSLVTNPDNLQVSFRITENGHEMEVHYNGILPDTFKEGSEVIVEGKYTSEGYFDAQTVMAKCPSKYESADGYNTDGTY